MLLDCRSHAAHTPDICKLCTFHKFTQLVCSIPPGGIFTKQAVAGTFDYAHYVCVVSTLLMHTMQVQGLCRLSCVHGQLLASHLSVREQEDAGLGLPARPPQDTLEILPPLIAAV
jgi:hypothetical protein